MNYPPENLPAIPAELIQQVSAFLRLDHDQDDLDVARLLRSAAQLCENFIGALLLVRSIVEQVKASTEWQPLRRAPVQAITQIGGLDAQGESIILPAVSYAIDIDSNGIGWVKFDHIPDAEKITVTYTAGLASNWDALPSDLYHGVVRMAGYLYTHRDRADLGGPPLAVTALWRPHRRMRLS